MITPKKTFHKACGIMMKKCDPDGYGALRFRNVDIDPKARDSIKREKESRNRIVNILGDDLNQFWEFAHMEDVRQTKHFKKYKMQYALCYFYQGLVTESIAHAAHYNSRYLVDRSGLNISMDKCTQIQKINVMFMLGLNLVFFIRHVTFRTRIYVFSTKKVYSSVLQASGLTERKDQQEGKATKMSIVLQ